jgi:hypothetical protein
MGGRLAGDKRLHVDIAVLRLNDQIADFEEIKERVTSLPATMMVVDCGTENMRATYAYPFVGCPPPA